MHGPRSRKSILNLNGNMTPVGKQQCLENTPPGIWQSIQHIPDMLAEAFQP